MSDTAYERITRALREHGHKVTENGQKAEAQCPGHDDGNASLSITGQAERTLMYCHAGCETRDVMASLGLTMADLYDQRSAEYRYPDGRVIKRFYDGRTGRKRFVKTIDGGSVPVLYHADRLARLPKGAHVFLVEGEADVQAIEEAGGVAVTAPHGANSFHKVDVEPLRGLLVTAIVDRPTKPGDTSGAKWAQQVAAKLEGVAEKYRFMQAREGKDASDHIAAGHGLTDFEKWQETADQPEQPDPAGAEERARRIARIRSLTYRRSELNLIQAPGWLVEGVMTRASLTLLSGKFGTYKSFVSIALAASVATGRPFIGHPVAETGPVVYIAAEGASGIRTRLEAWEDAHNGGVPIPDDMLVVIGGPVKLLNDDDMAGLDELCKEIQPRLVVWDTLHRCAPGLEEDKSKEAGLVIDVLSAVRENYDCTQLVDHHTGHSGQRARGSSAWEDDFDNSWVIKLAGDGEDRSAANQRTMEHRKVKDGELSGKIPIGLVPAVDSAYVDRIEVGPPPEDVKGWLIAKAYAERLDLAGVPLSYGRERIAKALQQLGVTHKLDNNLCSDIARIRKSDDYTPYSKPSVDV